MKKDFYEELKKAFSSINEIYKSTPVDKNKLDSFCGHLRYSKKLLVKKSSRKEKHILGYCIDTVLEIVKENDASKIIDFTAVARELPDIFLGKRNLFSFRKEIDAFQDKYGDEYFSGILRISYMFNKGLPKNALSYFLPNSDDDFKAKHPIAYPVIVVSSFLCAFAPMILSVFCFYQMGFDAETYWWIIAFIGSLIMGIGIFNLFAALLNQYLGHWLTLVSLLIGGALMALSFLLTFNDTLSTVITPEQQKYWFFTPLITVIYIIEFLAFRSSLKDWMKRTRSLGGTDLRKMKKGKADTWFFRTAHKEVGLGAVYYLNALFTVLLASTVALSITLGFIKYLTPLISALFVALAVVSAVASVFAIIQENIANYGKPIILFRCGGKGQRTETVFFHVMVPLFLLAAGYANLMMLGDIWGFDLPVLL